MGFHVLQIFAFILLIVADSSHASTLPAKTYWNSVFPDTPIPKILLDQLQTETNQNNFANMVEDFQTYTQRSPASFQYATYTQPFRASFGRYMTVYFFQNDLHQGKQMRIPNLPEKPDKTPFLPRGIADSIPFSTEKLPEIMKRFSVQPDSLQSKALKQTIQDCEAAAVEGEEKFCPTSFESLIYKTVSKLGKNIQLLSTEFEKETSAWNLTIGGGVKKIRAEKQVVCHKEMYPYAVFMCHSVEKTDVYEVPLVWSDGTKAKVVAICHKDTSAWTEQYPAFQQLNVKPGSVPICHFLTRNIVVWVPDN